jgi:hypothetical protein
VIHVAKPIQYVVELNRAEAESALEQIQKPNPRRTKIIRKAEETEFNLR